MGAPEPQGIPFQRNAGHEAGGLQLSPEDWLNNFLKGENNSDLAKVQSQGVPEGILQRARGGTDQGSIGSVSPEFANAQAADQAARNNSKIVDPDGRGTPVSRGLRRAMSVFKDLRLDRKSVMGLRSRKFRVSRLESSTPAN